MTPRVIRDRRNLAAVSIREHRYAVKAGIPGSYSGRQRFIQGVALLMTSTAGFMVWRLLRSPHDDATPRLHGSPGPAPSHATASRSAAKDPSGDPGKESVQHIEWWHGADAVAAPQLPAVPSFPREMAPSEAVSDPASLLAMVRAPVAEEIRLEALRRLCEITEDSAYAAIIAPLLRNRHLPGESHTVLMTDLRRRPLGTTAAGMLTIADAADHPRHAEAVFWLRSVCGLKELPEDDALARQAVERSLGQRVAALP
jgi:hypothetical protein